MDNNEKYELLFEGEVKIPSIMGIYPGNKSSNFDATSIKEALTRHTDFKLKSFEEKEDEQSQVSFYVVIEFQDATFNADLHIVSTENVNLQNYGFAASIDENSLKTATEQKYFLEVWMYFELDPLSSFHLQLKIMDAIVPDASLVVDFSSHRQLSAKWLRMAARSSVPPSPDYLYTLHGVYDENGKNGEHRYWYHTHGLHRCGTVELELLNFKIGVQEMNTLINMTVKKFLFDPAKENEKFTIGYDGLGIDLCWLKWEEALKDMPQDILGGMTDREGDDNDHTGPSGILFAVQDGNRTSPEIYASTLAENPIFYISSEETERMRILAKERFPLFVTTFNKEHKEPEKKSFFKKLLKTQDEQPAWRFLVKLGLIVDNADSGEEKEHLWFEVLSVSDDKIEGKLLNQPYWISALKEGDVKTFPLEVLTDWLIYSPDNTYSPDSAYLLEG